MNWFCFSPGWRLALALAGAAVAAAGQTRAEDALRFDREVINRYSLDHLPRSLSLRWGRDVWLGYDLERGKLYKLWQAPEGKPGLRAAGFTTRSAGTTLYEDKTEQTWSLRRGGALVPLAVRYLGCAHREDHVELSWELRHEAGSARLVERVALVPAGDAPPPWRRLRAEGLGEGEALALPPLAAAAWRVAAESGEAEEGVIAGGGWHRLTLR